jgi:hypothetical protein
MRIALFVVVALATLSCAVVLDFERLHETKPPADAGCDAGDC